MYYYCGSVKTSSGWIPCWLLLEPNIYSNTQTLKHSACKTGVPVGVKLLFDHMQFSKKFIFLVDVDKVGYLLSFFLISCKLLNKYHCTQTL